MRKAFARFRRSHEFWLLVVILVFSGVLSVMTNSFLTLHNLSDLLTSNAYVGILCAGLLVVLISGGIDISFTAVARLAQFVALTLANAYPDRLVRGVPDRLRGRHAARRDQCVGDLPVQDHEHHCDHRHAQRLFWPADLGFSGGTWIYVLPDWFLNGISWFEVTGENGYTFSLNLQFLVLMLASC